MADFQDGCPGRSRCVQRGQAVVELALVLPVLLFLSLAVLAVGRVTQAHMAARAVVWEAARAGALASSPADASQQGLASGLAVADAYHLQRSDLHLTVDASDFRRGGEVRASVRYAVSLADLPVLDGSAVSVSSQHAEPVDLFRSGIATGAP